MKERDGILTRVQKQQMGLGIFWVTPQALNHEGESFRGLELGLVGSFGLRHSAHVGDSHLSLVCQIAERCDVPTTKRLSNRHRGICHVVADAHCK